MESGKSRVQSSESSLRLKLTLIDASDLHVEVDGVCYSYHLAGVTRGEAEAKCDDMGGAHLVRPDNWEQVGILREGALDFLKSRNSSARTGPPLERG